MAPCCGVTSITVGMVLGCGRSIHEPLGYFSLNRRTTSGSTKFTPDS